VNRQALALAAALIVAAAGVLLWQRVAVDETSTATSAPADTGAGPAPRTPWGEPDLSGVWQAAALGARDGHDTFDLAALERLYTAAARAQMAALAPADDPTLRCAPPAFPRAAMLGARIQIFQRPEFAFVLTEAYQSWRSIPTSGRPHTEAEYLYPTFMGDSAAHWEGDTLVVDVTSFNAESWLAGRDDRPTASSKGVWPTSGSLHVTERWRRLDADTLEYRATVEDPEYLTAAWEPPAIVFERQAVDRISEVMCQTEDGTDTYLERLD